MLTVKHVRHQPIPLAIKRGAVMFVGLWIVSSTKALAAIPGESCDTVKFRGVWVGTCDDDPRQEATLTFPDNGACGDVSFRGEHWQVGVTSNYSVSYPPSISSLSQITTTFGATWNNDLQALRLFRTMVGTPSTTTYDLDFHAWVSTLSLAEPGRLVETIVTMDLNESIPLTATKRCEYHRQP